MSGWRVGVLTLSALPLIGALWWWTGEWAAAILLTVAVLVPSLAGVLVLAVDTSRSSDVLDRLLGPSRRIPSDLDSIQQRVDVFDLVLSSETRRPWEPTTLALTYIGEMTPKPVLLLPGADYHLPEITAIADELGFRGIPNVVAVGVPHWDRTGDGLIWYERDIYRAPTAEEVPERFAAVITMKDWAGYAPLVEAANDAGIPTFAKVEGAQDFHDVDTAKPRNPYRTAQQILCQGRNDYEALTEMTRTIVGSTRLERLWWAPSPNPPSDLAVINLNFTYGMLTSARDLWLSSAIDGCERAGIPYVISVHPAEKARNPHPKASAISASRLLRHATVLISRFSTLPYEAMARGVPFIYHNPHEESVPAFKNPLGAFPTSFNASGLETALGSIAQPRDTVRIQVEEFFSLQIDIDPKRRSEVRAVDSILESLG